MPNIPTVRAQEPIRVGGINVTATPQEFGADVGAAMEGLGSSIGQLGSAFTSVGGRMSANAKEAQTTQDNLDIANALADPASSFETPYNNITTGYDPGSGVPLPTVVGDAHKAFVDERVAAFEGSPKAKAAYRLHLLSQAPAYIRSASDYASTEAEVGAKNASANGLDSIVNDVRSNGATALVPPSYDAAAGTMGPSGSRYDLALAKGLQLINSQPGYNAAAKKTGEIVFRSNLASANFEALATAAKTPEEIMALREAAGSPKWAGQFSEGDHKAVLNMLDTRENQLGVQGKAQLTADINEAESVNSAGKLVKPELLQRITLGAGQATPDEQRRILNIRSQQEVYSDFAGKPRSVIENAKEAEANGVFNTTGAVPYLLSKNTHTNKPYYVTNLRPEMQGRLAAFMQAMPPGMKEKVRMVSGARTADDQSHLPGYGTAMVGSRLGSMHVKRMAADLDFGAGIKGITPAQKAWMVANAPKFGLDFPLDGVRTHIYEPWHVEMVEARGGTFAGDNNFNGKIYGAGVPGADGMGTAPASVRPAIEKAATANGLPPAILAGVWMTESGGTINPGVSKAGAAGPFQIMPGTAKDLGVDPNNFDQAADGAARYLGALYKKYGDMRIALQAYNWGPKNMDDFLRNPGAMSMPKETREYADKVMGHATGGGLSTAESPGAGRPGMSGADVARQKAFDTVINDQHTRIAANSAEYFGTDGGITMSPITPASTPDDFAARADAVAQGMQTYNVAPNDVKPFTNEEAAAAQQLLASNDNSAKLALMAKISAMGTNVGGYALKQLGEKDKVFAYAGGAYLDGRRTTAQDILAGNNLLVAPGGADLLKSWGNGTNGRTMYQQTFDDTMGASMGAFAPGLRDTAMNAANAIYAQKTRFQPLGTPFDPETYKAAIAEATGMVPVDLHGDGEITLLDKTWEGKEDQVKNLITQMDIGDWTEFGAVPNQPPVDSFGNVIPADTLAAEAHIFPYDGNGKYLVTLSDHQPVATNVQDPNDPTRRLPYILDLGNPEHVAAKLDEIAQQDETTTDAAKAASAFVPKAPTTGAGPTPTAPLLTTPEVLHSIFGRPATPAELAAHKAGTTIPPKPAPVLGPDGYPVRPEGQPGPAPNMPEPPPAGSDMGNSQTFLQKLFGRPATPDEMKAHEAGKVAVAPKPVVTSQAPPTFASAFKRMFGRPPSPEELAAHKAGKPMPTKLAPKLDASGYSSQEAKQRYHDLVRAALERSGFEGKELDDEVKDAMRSKFGE